MATVVKDFKIKSGLIVEGTTGKINNFDILTKKADDQQFIIDLIGGETLVKSVSNEFDVSVGGELSLDRAVVDAFYDAAGSASDAQDAAEAFATAADTTLYGTVTTDIATAKSEAGVIAQGYADDAEAAAVATAAADATTKANNAELSAKQFATSSDETLYGIVTGDIADARNSAVSTAAADATTKANAARTAAELTASNALSVAVGNLEDYADQAEADAIATAAADATAKANAAQAAAEGFATQAVADLVDGAPAVLDTLNELAAALQDNPDIISDLQDIAAGKQDTLTAGDNIDITGATISVVGLNSGDISDFNTAALSATAAAYDVAGAAATAKSEAEAFATAADLVLEGSLTAEIATAKSEAISTASADATSKANTAQSNAEGFAVTQDQSLYVTVTADIATAKSEAQTFATDSIDALTTDDIEEGMLNEYFTSQKAQMAAGVLLTKAETNLTNIQITTNANGGLDIVAENGVADSTTTDLAEGTNLYFTDTRAVDALQGTNSMFQTVSIDEVALQVAASLSAPTAGVQTAYSWAKADYRSAEFLVKVAYGTHTEISKVLLTLDASDNIAITEYGIVGTNGSASSISADTTADDVHLLVTTSNNNSTVTVMGTLLV